MIAKWHDQVFPCIEPTRCFLTAIQANIRLSSKPDGTIFSTALREDWEIWSLVTGDPESNGDTIVRSVTHNRTLCCGSDGKTLETKTEPESGMKFFFISSPDGRAVLYCPEQSKSVACSTEGSVYIMDGALSCILKCDDCMWRLEMQTGELCFLSSVAKNLRLQCNIWHILTLDNNWLGWEVWRFIELGNGHILISSWTHKKFLASYPNGALFMSDNRFGSWEQWDVQKLSNRGVVIRSVSHSDRFLSVHDGGIGTTTNWKSDSALWDLKPAHRGIFYFSSMELGKQIRCHSDGEVDVCPNRQAWEEWHVSIEEDESTKFCMIKSQAHGQGRYLQPLDNNDDAKDGVRVGAKDAPYRWHFDISPDGGLMFFTGSKWKDDTVVWLCSDLSLRSSATVMERTWVLQPCMPRTVSGKEIYSWAIGGTVALASIIAAPFAVMGVVGAMGFGAGGIVAGTAAAGMMSAEAIAAGGGVVAGGTVATLQSIGAAGLGVAGTVAAMSGGAVVGGAALGVSHAIGRQGSTIQDCLVSSSDFVPVDVSAVDRPLCSWNVWQTRSS